jgi:hypothetical protein
VPDKPGTFKTAPGVGKDEVVEFVPFYRLHNRRYGVYWDTFTPQQWAARAAQYAAEQEKQRKLEAATVAYAQPGEMQPERDFNYQGEEAQVTRLEERPGRWRGQWFSFDLPVEQGHPMKLIVSFGNNERETRNVEIQVDGKKLAEHTVQRRPPGDELRLIDAEYDLPAEMIQGKQKVTVRFQPVGESEIPGVFGIRMIRANSER